MTKPMPNAMPIMPKFWARFSGGVTSATYAFAVLKLAAVMPEMMRPMKSSGSVLTSAIIRKSRPRPRFDSRITGRRPKRSDKAPCTGVKMNCIAMNTVANQPYQTAAFETSPPRKLSIRCGSTGMIRPNDRMSISTVTKMKISAARRGALATGVFTEEAGIRSGPRTIPHLWHRAMRRVARHARFVASWRAPFLAGVNLDEAQELGARPRILAERAEHLARDHRHAALVHAARRHALVH